MAAILRIMALVLACCALCAPARAATIKVGFMPVADCLQVYVAEDKYFFTAEGLAVIAAPLADEDAIAAAVADGTLAAGWTNPVFLAVAHAQGADGVFLAPGALDAPGVHALLVPAGAGATSIKGLAGKTVGLSQPASLDTLALRILAAKAGRPQDALRLSTVPYAAMGKSLTQGVSDAVLAQEPLVTGLAGSGQSRVLDPQPRAVCGTGSLSGAWFARKSWIAAHPLEAAAFARAMVKAAAYINANPAEARRILGERTRLDPKLAPQLVLPTFPTRIDPASIQGLIDLSAQYRLIPKSFPAKALLATPATESPADTKDKTSPPAEKG